MHGGGWRRLGRFAVVLLLVAGALWCWRLTASLWGSGQIGADRADVLALPVGILSALLGAASVWLAIRGARHGSDAGPGRRNAVDRLVPDLKIIDARVDDQASPQQWRADPCQFFFPAIDMKFVNNGTGAAFLTAMTVTVLAARVDRTPVLFCWYEIDPATHTGTGSMSVDTGPHLRVFVTNTGWGSAFGCEFAIELPILDDLFGPATPGRIDELAPGATREIGAWDIAALPDTGRRRLAVHLSERSARRREVEDAVRDRNGVALRRLGDSPLLSLEERFRATAMALEIERTGEIGRDPGLLDHRHATDAIPLPALIPITGRYADRDGQRFTVDAQAARSGAEPEDEREGLWVSLAGFAIERLIRAYERSASKIAYAVVFDLDDRHREREVPFSHVVKPAEGERFHVLVGATKSAALTIRISFRVNDETVVVSPDLPITVRRPANREIPTGLEGSRLRLVDGVIQLAPDLTPYPLLELGDDVW